MLPIGRVSALSVFLLSLLGATTVFAAFLGIDFGTQNVKAMALAPNVPLEMVLSPEAKRKDVSGLGIRNLPRAAGGKKAQEVERFYGSSVGSLVTRFPQNMALHLKPLLGMTMNDTDVVEKYLSEHPGVNLTSTKRSNIAFVIDGIEYPVEELVGMNLNEILHRCDAMLDDRNTVANEHVELFSLSVPEFYTQRQRMSLIDAASFIERAKGAYLVNDGLAVAMDFVLRNPSLEKDKTHHFIVYDMGSGSTRATLVSAVVPSNSSIPTKIEFEGYGYTTEVAGSHLTNIIADLIVDKFLEKNSKIKRDTLMSNAKSIAKINQVAEKMKLVLSANTDASGSIESLINDLDFKVEISREEFERSMSSLNKLITHPLEEAVSFQFGNSSNRVQLKDVDGVILTGGSTRVPFVQQALLDVLRADQIMKKVNADESTVNGITLRGVQMANIFKMKPLDIVDRSIFSYTIQFTNETGVFTETLFDVGATYPQEKKLILSATTAAEKFNVKLFENDKPLQTLDVEMVPGYTKSSCPKGVSYDMNFKLNEIRCLELTDIQVTCLEDDQTPIVTSKGNASASNSTATEKKKASKKNKRFSPAYELIDPVIAKLSYGERIDYMKHLNKLDRNDKRRFELQEAKNLLESSLYEARSVITDEDVAANGPPSELKKLNELVPKYLEWLENDSDNAKKSEFEEKKLKIDASKNKVLNYMAVAGDPLGDAEFQQFLDFSKQVLEFVDNARNRSTASLIAYQQELNETKFNFTKAYDDVKVPPYLLTPFEKWSEDVVFLNQTQRGVEHQLKDKTFAGLDREARYELKAGLSRLLDSVGKFDVVENVVQYRLQECKAAYERKLKVEKKRAMRQLQKSLKSKADEKSATASNSTIELTTSATTKSPLSSPSTSTTIDLHDEL
ncbi:Hsp70 family chaperone LHS1 KNAG_0H00420 [Huiozyma naganishii CBS 8797]|uniref:Uncharacterized protein n=1 Tax=Huiozyma naganishii (strain ATCC MYA-139 / BCRC 22969 / CBS 8797 / KCTC 17520 / NBRC 10181 / NCYC 3082 / Yp74L-3) TaxID=1071383 RepID=J7RP81_HUIN7|nr:hypothetical protein KNAG_0H00420 [Kazachstania naganishii CBS 8797]CCK71458.1 hypothetical protein KNAG_0H00420 [Kazachstania naganishii CBS 8797]